MPPEHRQSKLSATDQQEWGRVAEQHLETLPLADRDYLQRVRTKVWTQDGPNPGKDTGVRSIRFLIVVQMMVYVMICSNIRTFGIAVAGLIVITDRPYRHDEPTAKSTVLPPTWKAETHWQERWSALFNRRWFPTNIHLQHIECLQIGASPNLVL